MAKDSDDFEKEASASFDQGRYDEALKIYREGRRVFPTDFNLIMGESLCRFRMGDYPIVRDILEGLLSKGPVNPTVLLGLAQTYASLGRRRDAVRTARQFLKTVDPDPETAKLFGDMFRKHRCPRTSTRCYLQAIRWKNDRATVWIGLACALRDMRHRQLARRLLEKRLERSPEDVLLLNALGNLRYEDGEQPRALQLWSRIPSSKQYDPTTLKRMLKVMKAPPGDREERALRIRLRAANKMIADAASDAGSILRRFCGTGREGE